MGCYEKSVVWGIDQRTLCFHTMSFARRLCQGDLLLHFFINSLVTSGCYPPYFMSVQRENLDRPSHGAVSICFRSGTVFIC